jgi:DNA-binding NarL/FixJ family response regulator
VVGILIADDNASTLKAIVRFLEDERYRVVASVQDGEELVRKALALRPDVAVIDIVMPEMTGLQALDELKGKDLPMKVVILTAHREPQFVQAAIAAGASGYVLKHRMVTDLPAAIEGALRGERFVSPTLREFSPTA